MIMYYVTVESIIVLGTSFGLGNIDSLAKEASARQPEAASNLQCCNIIIGALDEGLTFGALILGK